ncbi:MAG: hypothetical protein ACOC2M_00275 [bacterium]
MSNSFSTSKINTGFDYFIVFLIIFYAGKATIFVQAIEDWQPIIGLLLPVAAFTAYGFFKNVYFNHRFWLLLIGYTLYFIASTIKFEELHPRFFMINIIYITMAYVAIAGMRYRFFKIYEDFLYILSIIAIVFWVLLNIAPETVTETFSILEFSGQEGPESKIAYNFIVYTVNDYQEIPQYILNFGGIQVFRNSGFAWEPGAFAVYVNIAIFANIVRNRFKLTNKFRLTVLIFALITTFSTTGYMMLVLLLFFYLYNQDLKTMFWVAPLVLTAVIYLFTLPFMAEKIANNMEFNTKELVYNSLKHNAKYQPQRFESLQIDFIDFLNHPIIGYGGHQEARWTNQMGAQISTVSGIGKIMAQYGLVGTLFFIISLWKSSKRIISVFNYQRGNFPGVVYITNINKLWALHRLIHVHLAVLSAKFQEVRSYKRIFQT